MPSRSSALQTGRGCAAGRVRRSAVPSGRRSKPWKQHCNSVPSGKAAFFDCGGTRLYLTAECAAAPESVLYLRVADIRAAYQELQSRGVEFTGAPHLIHRHADGTEEWMAFFKDPDGRLL